MSFFRSWWLISWTRHFLPFGTPKLICKFPVPVSWIEPRRLHGRWPVPLVRDLMLVDRCRSMLHTSSFRIHRTSRMRTLSYVCDINEPRCAEEMEAGRCCHVVSLTALCGVYFMLWVICVLSVFENYSVENVCKANCKIDFYRLRQRM